MNLRLKTWIGWSLAAALGGTAAAAAEPVHSAASLRALGSVHGTASSVTVYDNGDYAISAAAGTVIRSDVEADVDAHVWRSSAYPRHTLAQSEFHDQFGGGSLLTVVHTGLAGAPDLDRSGGDGRCGRRERGRADRRRGDCGGRV